MIKKITRFLGILTLVFAQNSLMAKEASCIDQCLARPGTGATTITKQMCTKLCQHKLFKKCLKAGEGTGGYATNTVRACLSPAKLPPIK